jgi:hypothetical protein
MNRLVLIKMKLIINKAIKLACQMNHSVELDISGMEKEVVSQVRLNRADVMSNN